MSLITSRGLIFPTNHRESAERSTSVSSCDEPATPPASMDGLGSPSCAVIADSSHLSVSLLYPDTAPRSAWRPQIDAWMRRNHPSDFKRISTMADISSRSVPYKVPASRSAVPSPPPEVGQFDHPDATAAVVGAAAAVSPLKPQNFGSQEPQKRAPPSPQYTPLFVEYSKPESTAVNAAPAAAVTSPIPPPVRPLGVSMEFRPQVFAVSSSDSKPKSAAALPSAPAPVSAPPAVDQFAKLSSPAPRTLLSPPASPPMPNDVQKTCISCSCSQSPCWRPSWSPSAGQLCNSCGLRYKKTGARCVNTACGKIPSKGEWNHMIRAASTDVYGNTIYSCLQCHGPVALRS